MASQTHKHGLDRKTTTYLMLKCIKGSSVSTHVLLVLYQYFKEIYVHIFKLLRNRHRA